MDALSKIYQVFERVLNSIRTQILPRILNVRMGKNRGNVGAWIILLFFTCLIRPTDLTGESRIHLPFKHFGVVYALGPASLYAWANVEMFKHLDLYKVPPPPDSASIEMIFFLEREKIMFWLAVLLILSGTYLFGLTRWAYHKLLCRLLGPSRSNGKRASLAYFLLKSCANMAILSLFAWMFIWLRTLDQNTVNIVTSLETRVGDTFSAYGGNALIATLTLGATAFILASVAICRLNGRAAMREIYLTDGTSEQVIEVQLLLAVTLFAAMTFLPRLVELWH